MVGTDETKNPHPAPTGRGPANPKARREVHPSWPQPEGSSMPAKPVCPWFRASRGAWFVTLRGKQHLLGDHPEGAPTPRKHKGRWNAPPPVVQRFHELLAREPEAE